MADNPLLPQHRLRELHALMLRVRKLERRQPHTSAREALLASMLLHLTPGDLLSGPANDRTLRELAPASISTAPKNDLPPNLRLPLCAGASRGMQAASPAHLTVAYMEPGTREPGWLDAITWAHRDQLPFLLICADSSAGRASRADSSAKNTPLTWPAVSQLAKKLHLPLFPVDGDDAVAVFRVMQETTARARAQGGPSILWAVLSPAPLPRKQQPVARLETYMSARGISLEV
ncbi:MAG TPA: thiamine pyrophosphate-dependent enzyme [Acidobacteriaceae bacterium]